MILYHVKKHKKNLSSANLFENYQKIVSELKINPFLKTHKFELLENRRPKPNLYSKKVSRKDRIVYSIDSSRKTVTIFSAWGHYANGNQSLIHHKL